VRDSGGGLSRDREVLLLPLGDGGGLLSVGSGEVGVAAWHGRQDGGGGWRRTLGLGVVVGVSLITMLDDPSELI
jgi:hypothetical protein